MTLCFNTLVEKVVRSYHEKGFGKIRAELYIYVCPTNDIYYVDERIQVAYVDKGYRGTEGFYNLVGKNIKTGHTFTWYLRPASGSKNVLQVKKEYGKVILYVGSQIRGATNSWSGRIRGTSMDRHTIEFN